MMHWQHIPYVLPLVIVMAVSAALALYAWRRRPAPGATMVVLMMVAVVEWSLGYALELGSADLPTKVFWARVQYLGIVIVPMAWLAFVLQYTGREKWLTRRNVVVLAIEPLVTLLLAWTNDVHGLIWSHIRLDTSGSFPILDLTHGALFWVYTAYSYLLLLFGTLLLLQALLRSPHLYRGQASVLLIGVLAPWVGNALYISGLSPFPHLDLTPFGFTLTGLAVAWGLLRFQLLDIVPVARDALIESMSDGVIVLDTQNRIVDLNPAAERIIGRPAAEAIGRPAAQVLPGQPDLALRYRDVPEKHAEIVLGEGEAQRTYDLGVSLLHDQHGRLAGRLVFLCDITGRKQAEDALRGSAARIRAVLNTTVDGIITIDERGTIETFNLAAERIFGYDAAEVIGQNIKVLMPEPYHSQHDGYINNYLRTGKAKIIGIGREVVGRRKDGTIFPMDLAVSKVRLGDRQLFTGIVRDITDRKIVEKMLKEYSERLEDMVEERTRELREAQAQLLAQQRFQQEIELAAQVQASLLPRGVPALEGFEFATMALPARYVSGDLYDFTRCDPETCHIVLADIAGKGVPAALLTSTARARMRAEMEHEDSPAAILSSVNRSLYEDLAHAEMFITLFTARLDARLGTLTYANAGHTETLWWQHASQTCRTLPATGLPMGIYADEPLLEETIALRPGDTLVFYSDGITEAANPHDELFGLDRLIATVSAHAHLSASDLAQVIVEVVETFRADAPRSDDVTLIVLKALPRTISFTYPATLDHLNDVTALVQRVVSVYGSDFTYQMELAASEIVTNIIEHAYRLSSGEVCGQIALLPDRVQLDLYDDGAPFDLSSLPAPDLTELHEGGYGLFIARQLTDELFYDPATPDGNHWRLIKLIGGKIR